MRLRDADFNFTGLPVHRRLLISVPFLSTGGALAVFILTGVSLQVGMIVAAVLVTGAVVLARTRLPEPSRRLVRSQAVRGIAAGLLATAAYDLCRFTVVSLTDIAYWPFDVFSRFGRLLVGEAAPAGVAVAVGTGYHYLNGVGFAIAYMLLVRRPGILTGLAWAAMLEIFMVSLYPGWLGLRALGEFLSVSIAGHAAYGVVLGTTALVWRQRAGEGRPASARRGVH
jgi:hypothetical protein